MRVPALLLSAVLVLAGSPVRADWTGELRAGVPILETNELKLSGGLALGYSTESFDIRLEGALRFYDLERQGVIADNFGAEATGSVAYLTGERASTARFEIALAGGSALYDSTLIDSNGTASLRDHTSVMGRGSVLVGGRLRLESISVSLRAGGGLQLEVFDSLSFAGTTTIQDTEKLTLQLNGRLHARAVVVPEWLAARLALRVARFELTRDDSILRVDQTGNATLSGTIGATHQLELGSRLSIDLDVLRFAGFVPSVFTGLDFTSIAGDVGESTTLVPVFGLELARFDDV